MNDPQNNPQITLRLSADQIENLIAVLAFAELAKDPPIAPADISDLYETLSAHVDEHVVFEDEEDE